jgi:hypothetical protein
VAEVRNGCTLDSFEIVPLPIGISIDLELQVHGIEEDSWANYGYAEELTDELAE